MQRHEEAFHVPVEAAFSHLVRLDLDKRVVATLGPAPTPSGCLTCRRTSATAACDADGASCSAGKNASAASITAAGVKCVRKKWRIPGVTGRNAPSPRPGSVQSPASLPASNRSCAAASASNRGGTGSPSPRARPWRRTASSDTYPAARPFSNPLSVFFRSSFVAKIRPSPTSIGWRVFLSCTTDRVLHPLQRARRRRVGRHADVVVVGPEPDGLRVVGGPPCTPPSADGA